MNDFLKMLLIFGFASFLGCYSKPKEMAKAPEFTLRDLSDEKVSLHDFKNKVLLINFFATWCRPCVYKIPVLKKMYDKHKKSGLVVIGINIQQKKDELVKFVDKMKINYPILLDEEASVAAKYNVRGIPTYVLIDKTGFIQFYGHVVPEDSLIKSLLEKK